MKRTPLWFLFVVAVLVIYGTISIFMLDNFHGQKLLYVNLANITITIAWIIFNIGMWFYFVKNNYEKEAVIMTSYYIILNLLNAFNIWFVWVESYAVLRGISIATKTIEALAICYLIFRDRLPLVLLKSRMR